MEVIVSDGGSADGSDKAALDSGAILVSGPRGRGGQLARGAAAASGSILLFLHADSSPEIGLLVAIRTAVAEGSDWGCASLRFDEDSPALRLIAWGSRARSYLSSICFGDQGIWCRTSFYAESSGFADIPLMEDVELSRRLRKRSRARTLPLTIVSSARRFRSGGVLRVFLRMKALQILYAIGVSPQKLAGLY